MTMNRRSILKKAGAGLVATGGIAAVAGTASADCGDCFTEECTCTGHLCDCGVVGTDCCCDGEWDCDCVPTCEPGCPC